MSDARELTTEIERLLRQARQHLASDDPYSIQRGDELVWDALCRFDALHEAITDAEAEAEAEAVAPTRVAAGILDDRD